MTIRLIASVFVIGLATMVFAQPSGGGGAGGGDADENPQNPLNWEALPNVVDGEDHASRREYEYINNVWQEVTANYFRDWSDMIWYRNGVPLGNVDFAWPFSTSVPNTGTSMSSEGTVTMRLRWKPDSPPPTSVRVKVSASSIAMGYRMGTAKVDNGIGSPTHEETEYTYMVTRWQSGTVWRIVSVNNGIAEYTISKSAAGVGVAGYPVTYGASGASAHGGVMTIDPRQVLIGLSGTGAHYKRNPGPDVAQVLSYNTLGPYTWDRSLNIANPPSNLFVTVDYPYTYPSATREAIKLSYGSPVSNHAVWYVGWPVVQQLWMEGPGYNTFSPHEIDDFQFSLYGAASTDWTPVEHYEWNAWGNTLSGDLPEDDHYLIPDMYSPYFHPSVHLVHTRKFDPYDPYLVTWAETTHNFGPNDGSDVANLTYTWADGAVSTANRTLIYMPDVEHHSQDNHAKVDWRIGYGFESLQFTNGAFQINASLQGEVNIPGYMPVDYRGVVKVVAGALAVAVDFPNPAMALIVASAAASGTDLLWELFMPEPPIPFTIRATDPYPAKWFYDGAYHHTQKPGTTIGDYVYGAQYRPRKKITPTYDDYWNLSGFVSRNPDQKGAMESGISAPKILVFTYSGPGWGGGGGGAGGGGAAGGGGG